MPRDDWHMLVGLVIGVVVLFIVVIMLGLRFATRRQARTARETRASDVLAEIGLGNTDRATLLYGVWQTTMSEVILHVRDGSDTEVASVLHRVAGATITMGAERYAVVVTSGWRESAALMRGNDRTEESTPLCTFECRGWVNRLARYTLPGAGVLSIRTRWSLSLKPKPLSILQENRSIGQWFALGGSMYNTGRALVLPASIPLPIRLFILYKAMGSNPVSNGHSR